MSRSSPRCPSCCGWPGRSSRPVPPSIRCRCGAVAWPSRPCWSSEVQTGGASASDEFAEITNVGPSAVDLAGLELVYVTSTGGTVTRKASWCAPFLLEPGRHLFVANTSGVFAGLADATYSGGFAATGGAIVLRAIGGAPVDAVGWGDATNAFVEGTPVAAPPACSSIERKPGGLGGKHDRHECELGRLVRPAVTEPAVGLVASCPGTHRLPDAGADRNRRPTAQPTAAPSVEPTLEPSATPAPRPTRPRRRRPVSSRRPPPGQSRAPRPPRRRP